MILSLSCVIKRHTIEKEKSVHRSQQQCEKLTVRDISGEIVIATINQRGLQLAAGATNLPD